MNGNRTIRDVAHIIRGEVPTLLHGDEAAQVESALARLLDRADAGDEVADELVQLLATREETRRRMDELLPDSIEAGERAFEPLPGHSPDPIAAETYRCPEGDYEWPLFEAGERVPNCPVHGIPLVRAR